MTRLIPPHGGTLIDRHLHGRKRKEALQRLVGRPAIELDAWGLADLEAIGTGIFSPLTGFMDKATYDQVVARMCLPSGLLWGIPVILPVRRIEAHRLHAHVGQEVALVTPAGQIVGLLELAALFEYDKLREARKVYQCYAGSHPGVGHLLMQPEMAAAGEVWYLADPAPAVADLPRTPAETRAAFAERGWQRVVGFQTRTPLHRAHEHLQKSALEHADGLFVSQVIGETSEHELPVALRLQLCRKLLAEQFPQDRVLQGAYPAAMRYAGPREAVLHAITLQNYGCSHLIVGRDHAGAGNFYGPYDAQNLLRSLSRELQITPLFFELAFYCTQCERIASAKTCPHDDAAHVHLSETQAREMLHHGQLPPSEFARPELASFLAEGLRCTR